MLLTDLRSGWRLRRGDIGTDSGRRHGDLDVARSVTYIEDVYCDYLTYAGIDRFSGTLCEIGPGDNFGVALLAMAGGAERVVAIDRFYSRRDDEHQNAIYCALAARHDLVDQFDGEPTEETLRHVEYHAGQPAEDFFRDRKGAFDFIISRAVLEHLYDPISALDDMADALKPGGMLVHRIDLRDHGMFENMHPLTFLTIPEQIYRRMVRNSGRPNRVLLSAYRDWLKRSGLDGDVRITRLAGIREQLPPTPWDGISPELRQDALEKVEAIRPSIAKSLQSNSDEDLCVSGIVLRAWKSGGLRTAPQELQNAG